MPPFALRGREGARRWNASDGATYAVIAGVLGIALVRGPLAARANQPPAGGTSRDPEAALALGIALLIFRRAGTGTPAESRDHVRRSW